MPIVSAKVSESLTLALLGRVREMRAQGLDVASLAAGEPDFATPDFVIAAAIEGMKKGNTKYVDSQGIRSLREAIAEDYKKRYNLSWVTPDHIVVTGGSKQGIHVALSALLTEGDEVLVPRPYWVSYPSLVKATNGVVKDFDTRAEDKYFPTPELLEKHYTPHTKALIFSSPSNPTGKMITKDALKAIVAWCQKRKVQLIYDEIYERLVLGSQPHVCPLNLVSDEGKDIFCINALSKSLSMTGWRLGYVVSHPDSIKALTALQTQFITCLPGFIQDAGVAGLSGATEFLKPVIKTFQERLQVLMTGLKTIPDITFLEPEGAFYVMANVSKVIARKGFENDRVFCEKLLQQERTVIIPGASMGMPGWVRLSFATSVEEIKKAIERLKRFCA